MFISTREIAPIMNQNCDSLSQSNRPRIIVVPVIIVD